MEINDERGGDEWLLLWGKVSSSDVINERAESDFKSGKKASTLAFDQNADI